MASSNYSDQEESNVALMLEKLKRRSENNRSHVLSLDMAIWWSNTMVVIEYKNTRWLLPRPCLLEIKAKLCDMYSVLVYTSLVEGVTLDQDAQLVTKKVLIELCKYHVEAPQDFFKLAASWEGIVVAHILHRTEKWVNKDLMDALYEDLNQSTSYHFQGSYLEDILKRVSIPFLSELGTLSKITGHPLLDMKKGVKKLYDRVHKPIELHVKSLHQSILFAIENYVLNSIAKYHRWPNVTLAHDCHPSIVAAHERGLSPNDFKIEQVYGRMILDHWAGVQLEKELEFHYCENILGMLSDKAISVYRSNVFTQFLTGRNPSRKDTRLLIPYLLASDSQTDHVSYIKKYVASNDDMDMVLDHMIVRLVPKEKELKEEFRGFGCKTLMDRCRSIMQERNAMEYLHKFSNEQALSLSELELIKKIYSMLQLQNLFKDHTIFYLNFDVKGWNSFQRDGVVKTISAKTG